MTERVELKLKTNQLLTFALLLIFYQEEGFDWDDPFEGLKRLLDSMSVHPWKNGEHMGDCKNFPMTCNRCQLERYIAKAEEMLVSMRKGWDDE